MSGGSASSVSHQHAQQPCIALNMHQTGCRVGMQADLAVAMMSSPVREEPTGPLCAL